ncbi:MAG: SDR family NAD(P)-dependent oxidoreductase [Polyangiaceae bacterium]
MTYRTALITGASSGIGRSLAERLARDGTEVVLVARRAERLEAIVAEIAGAGGRAHAAPFDVADTDGLVEVIRRADDSVGGLDLVVANAGIGLAIDAKRLSWERIRALCKVNFDGAIATLTAVLPRMVERRSGHVVGMSSLAALAPFPMGGAYGASKAGLQSFLASVRIDLREAGVAATCVLPGFVHTEMTARVKKKVPMSLTSEQAADLIVRKLKKRGATIAVPGGAVTPVKMIASLPGPLRDAIISRMPLPDEDLESS